MKKQLFKDSGSSPLYRQISEDLRFKISSGEWTEGEKIPAELALCEIYNVSRITIRKAIDELVRAGYLYRERAKGTFVLANDRSDEKQHYTRVRSFTKEMEELGKQAKTLYANVDLILATEKMAKQLAVEKESKVLQLRRIRGTSEGEAFAYFVTHIPYIYDFSLDSNDYYGSFYEYLKKFGIFINDSREYVEAIDATQELQTVLAIEKGTPILKRVRMTADRNGHFKEISDCYYIGEKYRYYVELN